MRCHLHELRPFGDNTIRILLGFSKRINGRIRLILPLCLWGLGCAGRVLENGDPQGVGLTNSGGTRESSHPTPTTGGTGVPQSGNSSNGGNAIGNSSGGTWTGVSAAGGSGGAGGSTANTAGGAPVCIPGQSVLASEVINARDLGGVPLNGGATSACGQLYRGGPLSSLTALGCAELKELGIRTVIDLRIEGERASVPDLPCVFAQTKVINAPLPVPYSLLPAQYLAILNTYDSIVTAFNLLGDKSAYPIYFHCTYGRDRTGVLAAIILLALGASRSDVYAEYQLTALSGLYVPPDSLTAVLDDIDQRGGILAYLNDAGISP